MRVSDLINIINGTLLNNCNHNKSIKHIVINSKSVHRGDLFVAIKGKKYDAHDFLNEVIKRRPSAIVVMEKINLETDIPIIYVKDSLKALFDISSFYRSKFNGKMVAITGSVGKTMTKELVYDVLSTKYNVHKSNGNMNNHIGVPMTLTSLNNDYQYSVIEIGMNHIGEISNLSKLVKPDLGVITNIGTAHIGNLGSKRKIFKAKKEILDGMNNGSLIINNNKLLKKIKSKNNKIIVNDLIVTKIYSRLDKTKFSILINNNEYDFTLNVPGKHLVNNCLLAIKIGLLENIDIKNIQKAIYNYKPLNNRLNIIKKNDITIIDDCYNANYEAVLGFIDILPSYKQEKILILGDILELGKFSKSIHRRIGKYACKRNIENVIFVGKYMYYAHKKCKNSLYFSNNNELLKYLNEMNLKNKVLALKASRGMHFEQIINNIKKNDR